MASGIVIPPRKAFDADSSEPPTQSCSAAPFDASHQKWPGHGRANKQRLTSIGASERRLPPPLAVVHLKCMSAKHTDKEVLRTQSASRGCSTVLTPASLDSSARASPASSQVALMILRRSPFRSSPSHRSTVLSSYLGYSQHAILCEYMPLMNLLPRTAFSQAKRRRSDRSSICLPSRLPWTGESAQFSQRPDSTRCWFCRRRLRRRVFIRPSASDT